jgi:predicted neuraminidase
VKREKLLAALIGTILLPYVSEAGKTFLAPPQIIEIPDPDHELRDRRFQGIPSLAISPEGRFWATWYAGKTPDEDQNNYVVVATSGDEGRSWTERFVIDPDGDGPVRAYDPEVWMDPNGKLWFFWAQAVGHDGSVAGVWAMTNDRPDEERSDWSEPRRLTDGIMMCKPTVLSSGEWLLPASTWRDTDYSLWMLVRTKYGIGESVSEDRGATWSDLVPSTIVHPSARFFVRRLNSGSLLLVKHGPISIRTERSHLTAYLSQDDGRTWSDGLLLDERNGVSYPDGQQETDGTIHIIYDFSRRDAREILMATFTEDDITSGDPKSASFSSRRLVSKYPEGENKK